MKVKQNNAKRKEKKILKNELPNPLQLVDRSNQRPQGRVLRQLPHPRSRQRRLTTGFPLQLALHNRQDPPELLGLVRHGLEDPPPLQVPVHIRLNLLLDLALRQELMVQMDQHDRQGRVKDHIVLAVRLRSVDQNL